MTTITKRDILRALKTEPLRAGNWINDYRSGEPCKVCAVGAVLRQKLPDLVERAYEGDWRWTSKFYSVCGAATNNKYCGGGDFLDRAPAGNYLSALSIFWEYLNEQNPGAPIEELRAITVDWAAENIPASYRVQMNQKGDFYTFKHEVR